MSLRPILRCNGINSYANRNFKDKYFNNLSIVAYLRNANKAFISLRKSK
jgi:hypothetical protein